jgi:hypothetical protein
VEDFINVYRLLDARLIKNREADIAAALFGISQSDEVKRFEISPVSGCISFADHTELWQKNSPSRLPATASAAQKEAEQFFEKANRMLYEKGLAKKELTLGFPIVQGTRSAPESRGAPIHAQLKHLATRAVISRDHSAVDHWLSQFMVYLKTGLERDVGGGINMQDAPVDGSIIDIRIGVGGKVIGLWSRWRPYMDNPLSKIPLILPPVSEEVAPKQSIERPTLKQLRKSAPPKSIPPQPPTKPAAPDPPAPIQEKNSPPPPLFYTLAGEDEPQRFIAPYSIISDEHDSALWPASRYSLMVRIGQESLSRGTRLHALVAGAEDPKRLKYFWGSWRPDLESAIGIKELGNTDSLEVDEIGVYNVILIVEDESTGAIAQSQSMIYLRTAQGQELLV